MSSAEERLIKALENPKLQEALADLAERADILRDLVNTLWEFKRSGVLDDLLNAAATLRFFTEGILSKDFMEKVAKLQDVALVAGVNMAQDVAKVDCLTHAVAAADADKQVGLMGLLAALRDPDVQRGLGFFISVLKNLGTCLAAKK
ncbi:MULTISPECIES: DUF1641 domain-containing protein [Pyrobaculum]|uniref:DUF1641 domain-containing protein n=3 Tax=Pyrobaculum TaxID=2276 RepID=A4WK68_PYRAR|nr:DUF1641 domain-containing protein [Pyrobaculum arsenaticum]ABP50785.1 protein of unknown function DUF1641 [Pyrobaculum arsenaticum DSM 13514]AFA39048.1 hypothetical protein Pogu_1021 [Pyrobaculum oguniense TE7]MCY0891791.1 DUF1641 domain-containing protein [Pyrobaculum arsenaticum]NYR15497.1 DUF1641 domain-containing protein [Pyrobaculum arsenaticum]